MGDIKTEPEDSVCHGCLSRDRKLSPLLWFDLYWSLLTEDQKIESLAIPEIAMCWECNAMVQRIQKFQLQVQKAHTILQNSELSVRSMDSAKQTTMKGAEAVPAREEAEAHSAKLGAAASRNTASGRDAGASSNNIGGSGGHVLPVHFKAAVRPFPQPVKSGYAQTETARGPNAAGAKGVGGKDMPKPTTMLFHGNLPSPAEKASANVGVPKLLGEGAQTDGGCFLTRRQKRRINAKERARLATQAIAGAIVADVDHNKGPLGLSDDSSLPASAPKRTKIESYEEEAAAERMALIPMGYPAKRLQAGHMSTIQGAVLALLDAENSPLPRITLGNIMGGALHFTCQGRGASTWFSSVIGKVEIAGLRLKVVYARDLPTPVKMAWTTRIVGVQDLKLMLRVLQKYHPLLRTERWEIVETAMAETRSRRIILMDRQSADAIDAEGYRLFSGVDLSSFKLLEDGEVLAGAEADPRAGVGDAQGGRVASEGDVNHAGAGDVCPETAVGDVRADAQLDWRDGPVSRLYLGGAFCLTSSEEAHQPTTETLSPLGVELKREYDAVFTTSVKQLPFTKIEVSVTNTLDFEEDSDDMQENIGDRLNIQEATNNKIVTSEEKYSDDEYKIEKSSDNDDDDLENNMLCTSTDETHPEQIKLRRSLRRAAQKSSQILKKPKRKEKKTKNVVTQPINFVSPPINPETEILLSKLEKTGVKIEKIEVKTKTKPLVKTAVIAQLEMQLKNLIKTQNTTIDKNKNGSKRSKANKKRKHDDDAFQSDFSDDDNFTDMPFENDDYENEADSPLKEREKIVVASLGKDPALMKLEQELKKLIGENTKTCSASYNEVRRAKRKREREEQRESDPDFCPGEDDEPNEEKTEVDDENKPDRKKNHKYRRVIQQYEILEDVLQYFTETELDEKEFRSILEKEDAIVNDKKPQKCFQCGVCFQFTRTLIKHAKYTHRIKYDYKLVKTPSFKIPDPPNKPSLWGCKICQRMLRKEHILAHMNEYHRHQLFCNGKGCEWCSKIFWDREDMIEHWTNIHKRFMCDYCSRCFRQKSALDWHIRERHMLRRSLPCPQCSSVFAARKDVQNHVRLYHAAPGPVELRYCVECDVTFRTAALYSNHISGKHKPKKRWPCKVCGRELLGKGTLESHMAIHHGGITKYQCEYCGKYLSKKSTLEVHIMRHKNLVVKAPCNKPCPVCGRMFQFNRTLRFHMYTHTGERPYACELCAAAYTQPHCLKVHLAKAHGVHRAVPHHLPDADK